MRTFRVKIKSKLGTRKFDVIAAGWCEATEAILNSLQISGRVAVFVEAL